MNSFARIAEFRISAKSDFFDLNIIRAPSSSECLESAKRHCTSRHFPLCEIYSVDRVGQRLGQKSAMSPI